MLPESGSRTQWDNVKDKIVRYVYSEGKSCSDESLESAILAFFDAVSNELKSVVPSNLQVVMKYASKTMFVLYALARAQDRVALDLYPAYRTLIADLESDVFTGEYGRRVDETCAILSEFADEFAGNLYDVCRWKAQNMLTHFRSESFGSLKPRTLQSVVDGRTKSLRRLLVERERTSLLYQKIGKRFSFFSLIRRSSSERAVLFSICATFKRCTRSFPTSCNATSTSRVIIRRQSKVSARNFELGEGEIPSVGFN